MAEDPSPPSPELTEELKQRIETNRLRALSLLAKRQASSITNPQHPIDYWKSFKSRKVIDPSTNLSVPSKNEPVSPPLKFRVRLEICSPDSFSINPSLVQGFRFPGQDDCFQIIEACLSNVISTHYTQIHGGGKASVYKLTYYDAVLKCLKNCIDIEEVEEIPWTTYNVMMKLSHSLMPGKWTPCRPEHLSDEKVEELIKKLPRKLLDTLLPFQLDGLKFGLQRGGRCLIADEMGLGKTLQAIAIASCFANEGLILVVCPAILRYAWAEELERWLPSYLPADIHLVFGYKDNPVHLKRRPKVVVISYTMLKRLRDSIMKWEWSVMIVDESHHIRCSKKKSEPGEIQAVLDVASEAKRIILLSGTPSLSRPGLLGKDKYEYANTYCSAKLINNHKGKAFMIRRLKEHLLVQLPPKRRQIISLSLKKADIVIAKNVVANLGESHTNHAGKDGDNDTGGHDRELSDQVLGISKVLGFFEWLSLHPIVTEAGDSNNTELDASSHKMIIFAHHLKVLDKLQAFLCNKGIGFVRIDGNILDCDRQNAVRSFQSSKEVKIAIIGITVGYAGLDLSVARNVVFLELPKDPTSLQQAEDRAHRRGQTNAVNIYIFCAKDTSDESRWRKLNRSIQRVSSAIDGKYDAIREIAVDNVSCIRNMNLFQSVNSSYAAPSIEKCPTDENVQQNGAEYDDDDVKTDETVKVTQELTKENDCLAISQSFVQVNMDSLRFAVSQYTGRVHLCICDLAEDSAPRSLSENFRIEEISADPSEWTSVFIKENPTCQLAIVSFINEWKNLKHIEKKKLFGKPLQLPLAIELLRLSESNNHDRNGLLKGGSKRRHTPLFEISCPQSNALFKQVCLLDGRKKKTLHLQYWTLMDEPLCKFCQNPCQGIFSKKPKGFFDLFCSNVCYDKYRSMTSGRYLRQELFQIERGVCTNCELDCHKLVQHLLPLAVEDREKYIEREAPQLTKHRKLLDKLVREPTEGNAWHADHIIAVFMGGGECTLENMRTLCVACHAAVTAAQRTQRCMENKLYRKALASFRRSNKKKTLRKNQSSAMEEKLDDDSELLIDVPGSNYSKESVEKKDVPGSNYSKESVEKKYIIPGSNYSEESEEKKDIIPGSNYSEEKKDIIPGSNFSEESEDKKDDSSLKQPLIADFSKFSFTGTC
uniref:DNA annealing helicase and endonuclease ZRANB3 n=1 Tax=Chenopodium quinoa TaxID=63459 RepID=A0A803L9E9_CHEQI